MASIREIRKQVASISSTRKITSAMEMVATSKMRRAQEAMRSARPYAERIQEVVQHVASARPMYRPLLMRKREMKHCGWILIGTDKGLCGGLNQNLFRSFMRKCDELHGEVPEVDFSACALGLKAEAMCRRLRIPFAGIGRMGDKPAPERIVGAIQPLLKEFVSGNLDRIYLARNTFVSTVSQQPQIVRLAPLKPPPESADSNAALWDYIYEPAPEELLDSLLQRYVEAQVYEAVIENLACEQAAKMVAMKNATDNAGEMMDQLQLAYNNARQAAITSELADIIGGAEAV